MEDLHNTVRRTIAALTTLRAEMESTEAKVRRGVRLNLDLQVLGLRTLERELRLGSVSRRAWSLGQAAVPVLSTTVRAIEQQTDEIDRATIGQCQQEVGSLSDALVRFAEGR